MERMKSSETADVDFSKKMVLKYMKNGIMTDKKLGK